MASQKLKKRLFAGRVKFQVLSFKLLKQKLFQQDLTPKTFSLKPMNSRLCEFVKVDFFCDAIKVFFQRLTCRYRF